MTGTERRGFSVTLMATGLLLVGCAKTPTPAAQTAAQMAPAATQPAAAEAPDLQLGRGAALPARPEANAFGPVPGAPTHGLDGQFATGLGQATVDGQLSAESHTKLVELGARAGHGDLEHGASCRGE